MRDITLLKDILELLCDLLQKDLDVQLEVPDLQLLQAAFEVRDCLGIGVARLQELQHGLAVLPCAEVDDEILILQYLIALPELCQVAKRFL